MMRKTSPEDWLVKQMMALILVMGAGSAPAAEPAARELTLNREQASAFARLALKGVRREFPNKPEHVLNSLSDVRRPRELHPAFYGCYDWHSAVHGHWMLARLLRFDPELPEGDEIRQVFAEHLTAKNIQDEVDYFHQPNRQSFERMYGWAWLLKLVQELRAWNDPSAKGWVKNMAPLEELIAVRYIEFLPKQTYPIRTGVHANTAFGLAFAHDYARAVKNERLRHMVEGRARDYFARDVNLPASWEPSGADFFSPSLMECDLMRRVFPPGEFRGWLQKALPEVPKSLREPAIVTDRRDPQLVHLDGLNLSRAWGFRGIASALEEGDPRRKEMLGAAARHAGAALKHVASGDYAGDHWLASFAVYLLTSE